MRSDRNHEGYRDPTACTAVWRAHRHEREPVPKSTGSGYLLGEVSGFQEARRAVMR